MEAEKYSQEKNHREFYVTLNAVCGPSSSNSHPVRSKNGELLTGSEAIKNRWVEHFSDLLNQPSNVDLSIADEIDQLPLMSRNAGKYCLTSTSYLTELFVVFTLLHM